MRDGVRGNSRPRAPAHGPHHRQGEDGEGRHLRSALCGLLCHDRYGREHIYHYTHAAYPSCAGTSLFWDTETDPGARSRNPNWIGLIPDFNRGNAFALVFVIGATQVLAKATATALLVVTYPRGWWLYFLADHGLLILYRVARKDIHFFLMMPVAVSYVAAPIIQVLMKVAVDFTGSMNLRLPLLLGGQYWLFALFSSQVSVFVSVHLYNE